MSGLIWGQGSQVETTKSLIEMDKPATLALLGTTAKTEKPVNYRGTGEGMHSGAGYTYTTGYFSSIKK